MRSRKAANAQLPAKDASKRKTPKLKPAAVSKSRKTISPKNEGVTEANRKRAAPQIDKSETTGTKEKKKKKGDNESQDDSVVVNGPYDELGSTIKDPGWRKLLTPVIESDDFQKIINFLNLEHAAGKEILPPKDLIFNSLNVTPLDKVKVVIIGQDPYHDGSAHGLAFSIPREQTKLPSSLKSMFKELTEDPEIDFTSPTHGNLTEWAERGVLMLNAVLTVEAHKANSHSRCGWANFTDKLLQLLTKHHDNLVFILWGNFAQKKKKQCHGDQIFFEGAHPSGLTCGKFYGCRHFSAVNAALKRSKKEPIDWQIN